MTASDIVLSHGACPATARGRTSKRRAAATRSLTVVSVSFETVDFFTQTHYLGVCLSETDSRLIQKVNKSIHFRAPYAV